MQRQVAIVGACLAAITALVIIPSTETKAQPSILRRPVPNQTERPDSGRHCASRRSILQQDEQRLDQAKAELSHVDSELETLARQMRDLRRQQDVLKDETRRLQERHDSQHEAYRRECSRADDCDQYERLTSYAAEQRGRLERELDDISRAMREVHGDVDKLRSRVSSAQREYQDKRCNDLIPGQTDQSTIDRCSAIFSDWNRMQASLNNASSRLPDLKSRYSQLLTELDNLESRSQSYDSNGARCRSGRGRDVGSGVRNIRDNARRVGTDLDKLFEDIATLRGLRINVQMR